MTLTVEQAESAAFWSALVPDCAIATARPLAAARFAELTPHLDDLAREGYVNLPGILDGADVARLAACVRRLHEAGIPTPYAYVYEDFWLAFAAVAPFVSAVLGPGYRMMPSFWAWLVSPSDESAGWPPHRDRQGTTTVERDGTPHTLTVWLPLTDATPLNGCIHVVPMHLDEQLRAGSHRPVVDRLQDIRALPAPAGSLLAWNQAVLHWGGRASRRADGPRISIAFEFQRGELPPFRKPLLEPAAPPFLRRLGLIGLQLAVYSEAAALPAETVAVARTLAQRHLG